MMVWLALLGVDCAWAQDAPLPMPGVPPPTRPRAPLPPPVPLPPPGATPAPNPGGLSPEDIPIIDFVPAARPQREAASFELEYAKSFVWIDKKLSQSTTFRTVSQRPGSEVQVVLGDLRGAVWVSNDGLVSLRETLPSVRESFVEQDGDVVDLDDILSDVDVEFVGNNGAFQSEEALQEAAQMMEQAIDEANERLEAKTGSKRDQQSVLPPRLIWIDDVLFVGRLDGLFRSTDWGSSFQKVLSESVTSVVRTDLGFLAGTIDGVRYSGDGVHWIDQSDGTEGVVVHDLVALDGAGALAATEAGLYHTTDGFQWTVRSKDNRDILSIALDPDMPGRVWAGTRQNLLSSDDMGATFQEPLSAPLKRVVQMERLDTLHWLAATDQGVWETLNGGLVWEPVVSGLSDPEVTSLSVVRGRVLATAGGVVHELVRSDVPGVNPEAHAKLLQAEMDHWIPRGVLLDTALGRYGLTARAQGNPWLAYLLPRVTLNGLHWVSDGVQYNSGLSISDPLLDEDAGTIREFDKYYRVGLEFRWSPPGRKLRSIGGADGAVAGADVGVDISLGDTGGTNPRVYSYQADLARWVNELYTQRLEVVAQRLETARQPLMQQVFLELAIQELEANLDVYTNGAVGEWNRSSAPTPDGGTP